MKVRVRAKSLLCPPGNTGSVFTLPLYTPNNCFILGSDQPAPYAHTYIKTSQTKPSSSRLDYQPQPASKTMPRLDIDALRQRVAKSQALKERSPQEIYPERDSSSTHSSSESSSSSLPTISAVSVEAPTHGTSDPLVLIYNIRWDILRKAPRSTVLKQNLSRTPLLDLPITCPPLLVDGRMQIVQVPKWKFNVGFFWRSCNGERTEVRWKTVRLPWKIWMERNFGEEKWTVLWIERY